MPKCTNVSSRKWALVCSFCSGIARTDLGDAQTMTEGSGNAWFLHRMVTFRRRSFTFLSVCRVVTSPGLGSSVWSCAPLEVFRITFHLVLVTDHKSFFVSILFCFELTDVTVHITSSAWTGHSVCRGLSQKVSLRVVSPRYSFNGECLVTPSNAADGCCLTARFYARFTTQVYHSLQLGNCSVFLIGLLSRGPWFLVVTSCVGGWLVSAFRAAPEDEVAWENSVYEERTIIGWRWGGEILWRK